MKFSVLIPTRNRAEYLRYAIESVRRQDYPNWELIVCDNASTDETPQLVTSYVDPRIRFFRSAVALPVTENWNRAVAHLAGDYFIMLGDDDCLMKGYFTTLRRQIEHYQLPDLVYTSAYRFAYPGAVPDRPTGFFEEYGFAEFLRGAKAPFLLPPRMAHRLVQRSLNFENRFGFNMQYVLVSRRMVDRLALHGPFFQSPFPDFYAMNALFLSAKRILVYPFPVVTIGITPKSYGHYYLKRDEAAGESFLQNVPEVTTPAHLRHIVLPGSRTNTNWLLAMDAVERSFPNSGLRVNYRRYRRLQIYYIFENFLLRHQLPAADFDELRRNTTCAERWIHGYGVLALWQLRRWMTPLAKLLPARHRARVVNWFNLLRGYHARWESHPHSEHFANLQEVFERVKPRLP